MYSASVVHTYKVPGKKHSHALTVVLIVLAVLLAATGILSALAFHDPYAGRGLEKTAPSDALPKDFVKGALAQQECSFGADEVNGYLASLYQKHNAGTERKGLRLRGVAVAEASGSHAVMYFPVTYHGKDFGVSFGVTPSFDSKNGRLLFQVDSAHVGSIPVSPEWLLGEAKSHLPNGFQVTGNTVSCEAPAVNASVLSASASVTLGSFHMEDGKLKVSTKTHLSVG